MDERIKKIRASEKQSHIEMYSNEELYQSESWLKKPIKTIKDLLPLFKDYKELKALDLGCGVGRNSMAIARGYQDIDCVVECVDILDLAIEKLYLNAGEYGVASNIRGIVMPIEDYVILENSYDFIVAVSALEHVETEAAFKKKLAEIRDGIREKGIVCLVINSNVRENDKATGAPMQAQFEVNLSTADLQKILNQTFAGFTVLKSAVQEQQYDIPRENGISDLKSCVVSFVAQLPERNGTCSSNI